jgi:hypothetical protein
MSAASSGQAARMRISSKLTPFLSCTYSGAPAPVPRRFAAVQYRMVGAHHKAGIPSTLANTKRRLDAISAHEAKGACHNDDKREAASSATSKSPVPASE